MKRKCLMLKFNHRSIYYVICYLFVNLWFPNAFSEDRTEAARLMSSDTGTDEISVNVLQQEKRVIKGTVRDESGEPLIGVSITVAHASAGTITDVDGKYSISVSGREVELKFSYVGYQPYVIKVSNKTVINVTLKEDVKSLQDVVIVGYSSQKKETITGAISAVKTQDLLQSPQANISNALAGRMPGLLSVQRSGEPGKDASTLRIRGIGSFATSNSEDLQAPLVMVDGVETPNYNNIDPNEIESISILKDASATAVYGVRGANGVLLITTKRGAVGKPKVSLSSSVSMTSFPFLRENMDSYEYTRSYNKALAYDSYVTGGYNPKFKEEDIELYRTGADPIFHPSIDWYDEMLKKYSWETRTNLNISGGSERIRYFFSLGYLTQNGMYNTDIYDPGYDTQIKYRRYNMRSNFDINITKRLKVSFDISAQLDDRRYPNWDTPLFMEMLSSTLPYISPGIIDNKIVVMPRQTNVSFSPYAAFNSGWHKDFGNNLNGSLRLTYDLGFITEGLSARGVISYKNYNSQAQRYNETGVTYEALPLTNEKTGEPYVLMPLGEPGQMQFSEKVEKNRRIYIEFGLEYARAFKGHNVSALILYNQSKYHDPHLEYLIPNGYQGIVGRVTYNYKSRYLAEFNIGYNGTENFAPGKRFGVFPAYSLGWVVTEEPFFPRNRYLTFLKIRGSYGVVGNDKIGGDRFLYRPTSYSYGGKYYWGEEGSTYQEYKGAYEGKLGNPDLTWEKAHKMNIGADVKFWEDRISFSFDYFQEKRSNILANRGTVPTIVGANFPAYNLGKMKNGGFEFEITYNDKIGDFNYYAKANYTYAHNEIEYMDEAVWPYDYQYRTGHRFGQNFGYVADGLFNTWEEVNNPYRPVYQWNNNKIQPGDIRYIDINGDGKINDKDQVPIGYSNFPEKTFGLSIGGEYKGFDISILFQGAANVSTWPSRRSTQGFYTNTNAGKELLKSWSQERWESGQEIIYPRLSASDNAHNYVQSTYWLENANYLRLKNMEIGYTFRNKGLQRIGISSVRLYLNGNNLLTWSDLYQGEDPEFPNGQVNSEPYPVTRVYNLGFNVNF